MISSAIGMMTGKATAMFLGFAFWLFAARLASPSQVGLAAGATAAIMLVTLLSSSGVGAAAVVHYHRRPDRADELVDTALTLVAVIACSIGFGFLLLARGLLPEMGLIAVDETFAVLFLFMGVVGAVAVVLDQISMAQRRGGDVLTRNLTNGLVTLLLPMLLWIGLIDTSARTLFAGWVLGASCAVAIGWFHLQRAVAGHRSRPRLCGWATRSLLRSGVSNQLLTSAERAPGLILPIIVTELMSPAENAFWYTSWMIAWGVAVVPLSTSTALFAEACRDPSDAWTHIRPALRSSLRIGASLAAIVFVLAPFGLSLLGAQYSDAGAWPLRLLVLGVFPLSFTYAYFAVARSTGHIGEAIAIAAGGAILGVGSASVAGVTSGLTAMAGAWICVQALVGLCSFWRLRVLTIGAHSASSVDGRELASNTLASL